MNLKMYLCATLAVIIGLVACEEKPKVEAPVAPVVEVTIDSLTRTYVKFTIESDSPGDYAWNIAKGDASLPDAEELFETGHVGMFDGTLPVTIEYNELVGGNEYKLFVAVRKINPYVYGETVAESLTTEFSYTDMITLERVTTSSVDYHIEKPEGAAAYKHMVMDYNDYLYFKNIIGATYDSYLSSFGHPEKESATFVNDWYQWDVWGKYDLSLGYKTIFYSDTKYLILAGEIESGDWNAVEEALEYRVSPNDVKWLEFTTPKAEVCEYEVEVAVTDITSLTATVTMTPEEGVDRYRAYILSQADYDSALFEGEEMLRRVVIGDWEDRSAEYTEAVTQNLSGLTPDTDYYVCIVAFDENMAEIYIEEKFTTTPPVGPVPEIDLTSVTVENPWHNAGINVKMQNAVSAMAFVRPKASVDDLFAMPGNEGLTWEVVISNNFDMTFSAEELEKAGSEAGATFTFGELSPATEYIYAIMASNEEHVSTVETFVFKTEAEPKVESSLLVELQGEYTAEITDIDGVEHVFDITIADGVNDATREAYAAENILVCLGFDPVLEYNSPQDLLDKGWAEDEAQANRNYGPKFFLEIDKKDRITTYKHAVSSSSYDSVNNVEIIEYSAEGEPPMASFNDTTIWFKGTFWRDFASETREDVAMATTLIHDVDYDAETGVITIKPVEHYKTWSAYGQLITEYPGVEAGASWTGGSNSVVFCGNSPLVLTRKASAVSQSSVRINVIERPLKTPVIMHKDVRNQRPPVNRGM